MNDASGGGGEARSDAGAPTNAFDEQAFRARLVELNPWLAAPQDQHEKLRREATHARFAQGKDAWNTWAEAMLAEKEKARGPAAGAYTRVWALAAEASFSSAEQSHTFAKVSDFRGFLFPWSAVFRHATFSGTAGFGEARFSGDAVFELATFEDHAWFSEAKFEGDARFNEATFSDGVLFAKATFKGGAEFSGATFSGPSVFGEATFSGDAWFFQSRFEGLSTFNGAQFQADSRFIGLRGDSYFSLSGVTFDVVPDFEQAHFAEAPRLDVPKFPRAGVRPKIAKGKDSDERQPLTGTEETARWRSLKRLAAEGHDHEREQLFFARELQSLRGVTDFPLRGNVARYWFGRFYEWFSDFGRSMLRPLAWWFAFTLVFALFNLSQHFVYTKTHPAETTAARLGHAWHAMLTGSGISPVIIDYPARERFAKGPPVACIAGGSDGTTPVSAAFAVSLRKGLLFAGFGDTDKASHDYACLYGLDRKLMAETKDSQLVRLVPDSVAYAGLLQTLISAVLLFLFLLAMRNHFRIR